MKPGDGSILAECPFFDPVFFPGLFSNPRLDIVPGPEGTAPVSKRQTIVSVMMHRVSQFGKPMAASEERATRCVDEKTGEARGSS